MPKLVLVRHGQSAWNQENRFTGWTDVDLTAQGEAEARTAGRLLAEGGFTFAHAYTSVLRRAIRTLWIVLEETDMLWLPTAFAWQLNERHYGALQGLNKAETAKTYGDYQVHLWRRSFDVQPPPLQRSDAIGDLRYRFVDERALPRTESLKDTLARTLPYWYSHIAPGILCHQNVLIVAHGNSLRALVKVLKDIPDDAIAGLEIPTGRPWVFELDERLVPVKDYYPSAPTSPSPADSG